jgi:hypothetical protein
MGDSINRALFGGSKSKNSSQSLSNSSSLSENRAYGTIKDIFQPYAERSADTSNQIFNMLGLNGQQNMDQAFQTFRSTPGYQFGLDEGLRGVNAGMAGRGMLGSGAALKSLQRFGQGYADQQYDKYMANLFGMNDKTLSAGQLLSGAGQYSTAQAMSKSASKGKSSSSNGGIMDAIGGLTAFIP